MKLFGYWRSSASWRVRIGLALKGLSVDHVPVDLKAGEQHSASHRTRNPMRQVPVLRSTENGEEFELTQSLAILRWLDRTYPEVPLLPPEPLFEARVWELAELINAGIQPLQNLKVQQRVRLLTDSDGRAWCRDFIADGLSSLELLVARRPAPFLAWDRPSIADCCLIPQLYNARRFSLDLRPYTNLLRVENLCESHPAFRLAHPSQQVDALKQSSTTTDSNHAEAHTSWN